MLPTDSNLTPEDYVRFFVTDPNAFKHFEYLLRENSRQRIWLDEAAERDEDNENIIDDLKMQLKEKDLEIARLKTVCNTYYGIIHAK